MKIVIQLAIKQNSSCSDDLWNLPVQGKKYLSHGWLLLEQCRSYCREFTGVNDYFLTLKNLSGKGFRVSPEGVRHMDMPYKWRVSGVI